MKRNIIDQYAPTSYADGQSSLEARMMDGRTRNPSQRERMDTITFSDMERRLDGSITPPDMGLLDKFQIDWKSAKLRRRALTKVTEKKYDEIEKLVCEAIESSAQAIRDDLKAGFNSIYTAIATERNTSMMEALGHLEEINTVGISRVLIKMNDIIRQINDMVQKGKITQENGVLFMKIVAHRYGNLISEYQQITDETKEVVRNAYSSNK